MCIVWLTGDHASLVWCIYAALQVGCQSKESNYLISNAVLISNYPWQQGKLIYHSPLLLLSSTRYTVPKLPLPSRFSTQYRLANTRPASWLLDFPPRGIFFGSGMATLHQEIWRIEQHAGSLRYIASQTDVKLYWMFKLGIAIPSSSLHLYRWLYLKGFCLIVFNFPAKSSPNPGHPSSLCTGTG